MKVPKESTLEEEKAHFTPIVAGADFDTTNHSTGIEEVAP